MTFTAHIYKLCCLDVNVTDIYIGSCKSIIKRRYSHKHAYHNASAVTHNSFVYQFIREHGEWGNWSLVELYEWECASKAEMGRIENMWMIGLHATLNHNRAPDGSTPLEVQREYRAANVEHIAAVKRDYNERNAEQIAAYKREYRAKHQDVLSEQIHCACGGHYTREHTNRHMRSKRHITFEKSQQTEPESPAEPISAT